MADIGNLPSPGTKPWNLNPAIAAINSEVTGLTTLTTSGRLSEDGLTEASVRSAAASIDLREWVTSGDLPNNENGNATPLFTQVMNDLASMYATSGQIFHALAPAGRYGFDSRLTPPLGGKFGIRGQGMNRTRFLTAPSNSWLGMNQFQVGDPDFQWSDMYFEDFTIDGTAQPIGSTYVAGLKGFIMHNFRDTYFRRVKVFNTHATGFGIDYSDNVWFIECVADSCGRARATHQPDPETRFGSGSGFGIGFGQKPDEAIYVINSVARNNGASGIFGEQLGQPEAQHKSSGLFISNVLVENNAIGVNDTGTRGTQASGVVARHNTYAGYRVGISNASEQGGIDGQVTGLTSYGNKVGIALEGSAEGTYSFDGVELFDNSRAAVEFRDTTNAWPAHNVRFRNAHAHHNGQGFLGSTPNPIVGLEITDMLVHDNAGDALSFVGPLSRPRFTGRIFGNDGYALALRGPAVLESPVIDLDIHGSAGGGLMNQHTTNDTTKINVTGNPTTVVMPVTQPTPTAATVLGTDWVGQSADLAYATSYVGLDGRNLGRHVVATSTGTSPRVIGTSIGVTPGEIITASIVGIWPKGKSVQPAVRLGSGGTAVWVPGPLQRATGSVQRLHFTIAVPDGQTVARSGMIGTAGTDAWAAGNVARVTRSNVTRGGQLWPYIDGDQPNCAWNGTAGNSASTLTIPVYAPTPGFDDQFTRADGSVGVTPQGKTWTPVVSSGTTVPLVIASGKAKAGTGGNAPRTVWLVEGDNANGTFEAKIGAVGEHFASFVVRGTSAQDYIALDWSRSSSALTYRLSKRVANTLTEVAYASSVTSADNDVVQIILNGTSVEVKVNGATIFGGPQTITEHTTVTKHGIMLLSTSTGRAESVEYAKFTPAT